MKEQYYVPDITEFFVGYEYEYYIDSGNSKSKWIKCIFTENHKLNDWGYGCNTINPKYIRTPFITQKQIESLKWKYIEDDECSDLLKDTNTLLYKMLIFRYKKYELWWIEELKQIHLGILDSDGYFDTRYKGEIKSINELRYLMKLLNIK